METSIQLFLSVETLLIVFPLKYNLVSGFPFPHHLKLKE